MANKIQLRRDTAANWNRVNPVLDDGEPGYVTDTDQIKYGDGNTPWRELAYSGYLRTADYIATNGIQTESAKTGVLLSDTAISVFEGKDGLWFSQYGDVIADWDDDFGGGVAYLSDGNIIAIGGSYAEGYNTSPNMMLLYYSSAGEIGWQHEFCEGYGGSEARWLGDNVWIGRDDQIYATWQNEYSPTEGYIGTFDSDGSMGDRVLYYNGPQSDMNAMDGWIDTAPHTSSYDDRIYIVGSSEGYGAYSYTSGWIHQIRGSDITDRIWQKGINTDGFSTSTTFADVAAHANGAYVCGEGYDNYSDNVAYNGWQALLASWDMDGNLEWHRIYKQLDNNGGWLGFYDVKIDRSGDIIATGTRINAGDGYFYTQAFVSKIRPSDGEVVWCKRATIPNNHSSTGISLAIGANNQIYWMGTTEHRPEQNSYTGLFFMELDTNGNVVWQNTLGGDQANTDAWYASGHREIALSPDGTKLATTGYGHIGPTDSNTDNIHMITAQLPADGTRGDAYVTQHNLIYAPGNLTLQDAPMTFRDLGTSHSVDSDWWNHHNGFYVHDNNNTNGRCARDHALSRFGGTWDFANGDITLPYEGDILRSDGTSAIRDLKARNLSNLGNDYYIQDSDRGGLIYGEGYYTIYIPKRVDLDMPAGSVITLVNEGGNGVMYIQMLDADTGNNQLYGAGTNTNYYRWSLPENSIATLVKVWNDPNNDSGCKWILSGVGIAQVV